MKTFLSFIFCLLISAGSFFAQSGADRGIELYKKGNYKEAVEILKQEVKTNPTNTEVWLHLAAAQLNLGKLKDAEKSYKKLIEIDGKNAASHANLAYLYLVRNNLNEATEEANISLKLERQNVDAQYVLGVAAFRNGFYDRSYESAKKITSLSPNHSAAYLLKAESLISSFIQQAGTVLRGTSDRADLLKEADEDLQKYVSLSPNSKNISFYREYSDSIKFFASYYIDKQKELPPDADTPAPLSPNSTPLKIISKPRANYTDQARQAGVSGTITLLVNFSENKTIKNVLVLKSLGFGLDQQAVAAAKGIKFEPTIKDGKPVPVVRMVQYSFTLF